MTQKPDFDPAYRGPVSYIDKSREYYWDKGFRNPYRWATYSDVPFTALSKPLSDCRVGVITTAALDEEGGKNRRVYSGPTNPWPADMHTNHVSWHKTATHTQDMGSYLPLAHLQQLADQDRIGALSPRFYGAPTTYSQRQTNTEDAPALLSMCQEDAIDVALLIPL